MACSVIIISDDEDDVAKEPVIYISSCSEEEMDDERPTSATLIDSYHKKDDLRIWRKRKMSPLIEGKESRSSDDDCEVIVSSSDEELPDLMPLSRRTRIRLYSFEERKHNCICTLTNDRYVYSPRKDIQDHMHLVLKACDKENVHVEKPPESLNDNDICPGKINGCRRRISEEKQAGSLPLGESDVPYCSDKFEEEDVVQRIIARDSANSHDVYVKRKLRINDERQAASLPFIPVPLGLVPFSSLVVKSEVQEFHPSDPEFHTVASDLKNSHHSSPKMNFHVKSEPVSPEVYGESELKDVKPNFTQFDLSSTPKFQKIHEKAIKLEKIDASEKLSLPQITAHRENFYSYLERNQLLSLYSFTYLPFNTTQPCSQLLFPQSVLINTLLDLEYSAGLHLLQDFCSKFIPDGDLIGNLTDVIFKVEGKIRDLNLIYSVLLNLLQTFPNLVNLSENLLKSALSDKRKISDSRKKQPDSEQITTHHSLPVLFMIQILDLKLFSLNLCDARKMRHSLCHSLLSVEGAKHNVICILHEIGICFSHRSKLKSLDSNKLSRKFHWLSSLQHLIHLGLLTSRDMVNASRFLAKALRTIFGNIRMMQDKIIFLESIEHPMLGISLILEVMESASFPIEEDGICPSLITTVQYFYDVADSKTCLTRADSEEMVVMLYFCIRFIITCKEESVLESVRHRLLKRSVERLKISFAEKHLLLQFLDKYLHSLIRGCHNLTSITLQFFRYIKCLIDSLDEL